MRFFDPHPWRVIAVAKSVAEVPQVIPENAIVCIGDDADVKQIVFSCPCDHQHRIVLSTDPKEPPSWTLTRKGSRVWLAPEVIHDYRSWRCEFRIENSQTVWPRDEGRFSSGG